MDNPAAVVTIPDEIPVVEEGGGLPTAPSILAVVAFSPIRQNLTLDTCFPLGILRPE